VASCAHSSHLQGQMLSRAIRFRRLRVFMQEPMPRVGRSRLCMPPALARILDRYTLATNRVWPNMCPPPLALPWCRRVASSDVVSRLLVDLHLRVDPIRKARRRDLARISYECRARPASDGSFCRGAEGTRTLTPTLPGRVLHVGPSGRSSTCANLRAFSASPRGPRPGYVEPRTTRAG
jgi:hypothetical protein